MANFNDMDELELPSLDGLDYSDAPDAYEEQNVSEVQADNEPVVDELDYSLDDISAPMFSEMDGSASPVPEKKAEPVSQQKSVSLSKPSAPKPAFEEMGGSAVQSRAQTSSSSGSYSSSSTGSYSSSGTYSSGSSQSTGYNSVSGGSYSSSSSNSEYENVLDMMQQQRMASYASGRKKAQVLGFIMLGMGVLRLIASISDEIMGTNIFGLILGGLIIFYALKFMKGSDKGRRNLGWLAVLDFFDCVRTVITAHQSKKIAMDAAQYLDDLYTEFGIEAETTMTETINSIYTFSTITAIIGIVVFGAMIYFFFFDSSVTDYACDD